jgi:hypothetical protein
MTRAQKGPGHIILEGEILREFKEKFALEHPRFLGQVN